VHAQVRLLAKHIGKDNDEIEKVIARPTYFNPYEAVDFGIIDRVRISAEGFACAVWPDIEWLTRGCHANESVVVFTCHASQRLVTDFTRHLKRL
jgi:hypothetical protein